MEAVDHFYTFYGVSIAPLDLAILSTSAPELLVLIDIITQYECRKIIDTLDINDFLNEISKTPEGVAGAIASRVVPVALDYVENIHTISELKLFNDAFFKLLQLNIIMRLTCCICITLLKSNLLSALQIAELNAFSGQIGLFQNSKKGPLQIIKGNIIEEKSPVTLTTKGGAKRGGVRKTNRCNRNGPRSGPRSTRKYKQRGGNKWLILFLAILSTVGTPAMKKRPPLSPGSFLFNPATGAYNGGLPFNAAAPAVAAVAPRNANANADALDLLTEEVILNATFEGLFYPTRDPTHISFADIVANVTLSFDSWVVVIAPDYKTARLTRTGPFASAPASVSANFGGAATAGFGGAASAGFGGAGAAGFGGAGAAGFGGAASAGFGGTASANFGGAASANFGGAAPKLTVLKVNPVAISGLIQSLFPAFTVPSYNTSSFKVLTDSGPKEVLDIYSLPPDPRFRVDIADMSSIGNSTKVINILYYLGNTDPEMGFVTTVYKSENILNTTGNFGNFLTVGVADECLSVGERTSVETWCRDARNVLGSGHTHPVTFDRVHSVGSLADFTGFLASFLMGRGHLHTIGTQTGLLIYTPCATLIDAMTNMHRFGSHYLSKIALTINQQLADQGFGDSNEEYIDSNNSTFNYMDGWAPGRYRMISPSLKPGQPLTLQLGQTVISLDHLFDVAFVPNELFMRGPVYIPTYRPSMPLDKQYLSPLSSSPGFRVDHIPGLPHNLSIRASQHTVLPQIDHRFLANITCLHPAMPLRVSQNYVFQQQCHFELYQRRKTANIQNVHVSFSDVVAASPVPFDVLQWFAKSPVVVKDSMDPIFRAIRAAYRGPPELPYPAIVNLPP